MRVIVREESGGKGGGEYEGLPSIVVYGLPAALVREVIVKALEEAMREARG